jgi:general secretion pathway protein B
MSYILDALKKSEKERKKGTVPDPLAVQYSFSQEKKRSRRFWPYLLFCALMINAAAIYVFWFGQGQANRMDAEVGHSGSITVAESSRPSGGITDTGDEKVSYINNQEKPAAEKPSERSRNSSTNVQRTQESLAAPGDETVQETRANLSGAKEARETAQALPHQPLPSDNTASEVKTEIPAVPAPLPDKIYSLSELPLTVQQHLPAFSVSAFLYSDEPGARMARVNGKMMREGDSLAEGLNLEEIRHNELIFTYQNYRIRLGIK